MIVYEVQSITKGLTTLCGPGSVVGIATGYGLDGPGIESRWRRDFPHLSRPFLGPTQPSVQWVPGPSRGKVQPGHDTDPSPPSSAVVKKEYSYTFTPPVGHTACTETQWLYKGALYIFDHLLSTSNRLAQSSNRLSDNLVTSCHVGPTICTQLQDNSKTPQIKQVCLGKLYLFNCKMTPKNKIYV